MTAVATTNRQMVLANRPKGPVDDDTFALREAAIPELADGQFLVRTLYIGIDPAMRGQIIDVPSYVPPVQIGEVMRAFGAGEVVASRSADYRAGDLVYGPLGWQEYTIGGAGVSSEHGRGAFHPIGPGVSPTQAVNVLGTTGLTAYFGMLEVGKPVAGETVVVSGAAGATGSVAGQIAKIKGCRVIGIAGSPDKCAWLTDELGFDAAIDYRNERVGRRLRDLAPDGVHLFFDNVGGRILDTVLISLRVHGRVAVCGSISSGYNEESKPDPISNYFLMAPRRLKLEGFLLFDYADQFPAAVAELSQWMAEGKVKSRETIYDGLETAPKALHDIFTGANIGKLLVQVGRE